MNNLYVCSTLKVCVLSVFNALHIIADKIDGITTRTDIHNIAACIGKTLDSTFEDVIRITGTRCAQPLQAAVVARHPRQPGMEKNSNLLGPTGCVL